jgi:large conductance mechanosensitive channel
LAVGVVIGAAFGAAVSSLVEDIITPLLAAVFGTPDFSALTVTVNESAIRYGSFLNTVIAFVLVVTAIFFLVVQPVNALVARSRRQPPADPTTKKCPECLSEIPLDARRCAFCAVALA